MTEPEGVQVLTQGPIHEAFAQPVLFDPKPGPVVPKAPPSPIEEVPPELEAQARRGAANCPEQAITVED